MHGAEKAVLAHALRTVGCMQVVYYWSDTVPTENFVLVDMYPVYVLLQIERLRKKNVDG